LIDLYELSHEQLIRFLSSLGERSFRARQVWDWMYRSRVCRFDEMTNLPISLVAKLSEMACLGSLHPVTQQRSRDGTEKRLYRLADGHLIESVLMPYRDGRQTACISTQAGCALGCVFCATGQMGFSRNLISAEIFEQAMLFARELAAADKRLSNVVLMGMGEPFHNYDASLEAIRHMMSRLSIGARHITISTVGLAPQIRRFADEGLQVQLAVSLHKADDEQRSALMPINRRWNIASVIDACQYYTEKTGRRVTFEWAAIAGENDTREEAHRLGRLLKGLRCHVNIIPLNPTGGYPAAPSNSAGRFPTPFSWHAIRSPVRG
jgi:23S rRNA (adenine2503-C2)-methyltransferase